MLRELKKSLQFDSQDVSGVIEDLDVLLKDFTLRIGQAEAMYLKHLEGGNADERLERSVYGQFLELAARKVFFEDYKHLESLWGDSLSVLRTSRAHSQRVQAAGPTLRGGPERIRGEGRIHR